LWSPTTLTLEGRRGNGVCISVVGSEEEDVDDESSPGAGDITGVHVGPSTPTGRNSGWKGSSQVLDHPSLARNEMSKGLFRYRSSKLVLASYCGVCQSLSSQYRAPFDVTHRTVPVPQRS
jgi:hypothetical protein